MREFFERIRTFTDHPITKLVLGLILVVSSIAEGFDTFSNDLGHLRIRAHHGLLLFGLANVLACLPDLFAGIDQAIQAYEKKGLIAAAETLTPDDDQNEGDHS
jgi:hypothetical protein